MKYLAKNTYSSKLFIWIIPQALIIQGQQIKNNNFLEKNLGAFIENFKNRSFMGKKSY